MRPGWTGRDLRTMSKNIHGFTSRASKVSAKLPDVRDDNYETSLA